MNFKYLFGAVISIPLLPFMYLQGKRVRSSVPTLPEAKGKEGVAGTSKSKKLNLLTVGESTIAGVGVETHEEGFSGALAEELASQLQASISWKVYARGGYTAKRIRYKMIPRIKETAVDLIVIGLGGNDAFTLNNPDKWAIDIQGIIDALHEQYPKTPIIFLGMPPIKEFPAFPKLIKFVVGNLVELHGDEVEKIASQNECVFYMGSKITFYDWLEKYNLEGDISNFFSDGVHPSKLTYQTWAKETAEYIVENEGLMKELMAKPVP